MDANPNNATNSDINELMMDHVVVVGTDNECGKVANFPKRNGKTRADDRQTQWWMVNTVGSMARYDNGRWKEENAMCVHEWQDHIETSVGNGSVNE